MNSSLHSSEVVHAFVQLFGCCFASLSLNSVIILINWTLLFAIFAFRPFQRTTCCCNFIEVFVTIVVEVTEFSFFRRLIFLEVTGSRKSVTWEADQEPKLHCSEPILVVLAYMRTCLNSHTNISALLGSLFVI